MTKTVVSAGKGLRISVGGALHNTAIHLLIGDTDADGVLLVVAPNSKLHRGAIYSRVELQLGYNCKLNQ